MASLKDVIGKSLPGFVAGAIITAVFLPLMGGRRGRPLMKSAIRGFLAVTDRVKETTAEAREEFNDLVAEVKQERETEEAPRSPEMEA